MEKMVLVSNEGDRELKRNALHDLRIPLLRSSGYCLFLVTVFYILFDYWGQQLPVIEWMLVFFPWMFYISGLADLYISRDEYIFTEKYIALKGWNTIKLRWSNVRSWKIEESGEAILVKFRTKLGFPVNFRFHKSHGRIQIEQLFRKYSGL